MSPFSSDLNKVEQWLKSMNLKNIKRDEAKSMLIVPFGVAGKKFLVQTLVTKDWIHIKALVALLKNIPRSMREPLFYSCLAANFVLPEVTYSADLHGIWVEADMPRNTTEENFRVEFQSVVFGIKHFIEEIAPKARYTIQSTMFT